MRPGTLLLLAAASAALMPGCNCGRRSPLGTGGGSAVVVVDPEQAGRPEPVGEQEPNNQPKQAQELSLERGVEGTLTAGDRDCFRVTVAPAPAPAAPAPAPAPAPVVPDPKRPPPASRPASAPAQPPARPAHVLGATLSGVAEANLVLEALGEKRERLVRIDNSGAGEGEVLVNLSVDPGVLFLCVREANGRAAGGRYRLTYSLRPAEEGEEREPNWKAQLASPMPLEGESVGYLGWKTDTDWYRVEVAGLPPAARLRVEYDGVDEVRANLSVRSATGVLQERAGGPGEAITLANLATSEGQKELFVVVRTGASFNVESRYSVRVISTVPPGATEAEPNDRPELATQVTPGTPVAGLLGDTHDRDLFSVKVSQAGTLRVEVTPPLNLDAALALVDESGKVMMEVDEGRAREVEVMPAVGVRPPRALFQVRAPKASSLSPVEPYRIRVTLLGEGNEREPNAEAATATAWPAQADQMLGTIHPRADVDWYRVAVVGDRLRLRAEASKLKLRLEASGLDGTPRGSATSDAAGVARLDLPAEAGSELLLKISEEGGGGSPKDTYRLTRERP